MKSPHKGGLIEKNENHYILPILANIKLKFIAKQANDGYNC